MIGGRVNPSADAHDADKADLRAAYERGRRDERASRKHHPVLMTLTAIAALIGVTLLVLAAVHGSFGRAGGVVDQNLSVAADKAQPAIRNAAGDANRSLHDVGQSMKDKTSDSAG